MLAMALPQMRQTRKTSGSRPRLRLKPRLRARDLCRPAWRGLSTEFFAHPRIGEILREFVSSQARDDMSWSRPNRRFIAQGLYLPGLHSEVLGEIVIAIDCSGSISKAQLASFAAEVNGVLTAFACTATVLYHDSEIQSVKEWTSTDGPLVLEPVGGGGTSHVCVFDWIEREGRTPSCVVALTDLDSEFPAEPDVPVLWAVTGQNQNAPFGRVVSIAD